MAEDNSLGGRVRRYAQVSTAVGGLAARLAGERYLGLTLNRDRHAADLKAALGGIKGPLMKVAQLLATIPDALPSEYSNELVQLQADAPSMGWPFVKRRMASELGPDWQKRFRSFERAATRAASLGQVHRAVAPDGRALACKLQYPDMQSAVEADLSQLKLVMSLYERYDRAVSTGEIHAEIADRLREELDYRREARQAARNEIAVNMFRAWYVPFYCYGAIHGDPHLGNYTIRPDNGLNLVDFGCVRIFKPSFVKGVIDLYFALQRDDHELAVHAYEIWGFKNLTKDMIEVLNQWARFVYAPLLDDRSRKIQEKDTGVYGRDVAEKVHGEVRRLGGVRPPREFVFMDRAAIGLGSVFFHLKAEINWHRLFHELIAGFDVDALAKRQRAALKAAGLQSP